MSGRRDRRQLESFLTKHALITMIPGPVMCGICGHELFRHEWNHNFVSEITKYSCVDGCTCDWRDFVYNDAGGDLI